MRTDIKVTSWIILQHRAKYVLTAPYMMEADPAQIAILWIIGMKL